MESAYKETGQFTVWTNAKQNSGLVNFIPESYKLYKSVPSTAKRPRRPENCIKDAVMEHEIPFGTFRPGKHGRFPFNQNFRFEFLATSNSKWNSIFKNFQKGDNVVRCTQIFENFFPEVFFPCNFATGISRIFG